MVFFDKCPKRSFLHKQKKLDFSHPVGACHRRFVALLLQGTSSKVVPVDKLSVIITIVLAFVFLHEDFTAKSIVGCLLIGTGTLLMVL